MRLKSISILIIILFCINYIRAQYSDCIPDYTVEDPEGVGVRSPIDLPVAFKGEYYESYFTIIPPTTANTWGVFNTTITKIQITDLVNLPEGLVAESNSNNEDDFLIGGEHYCYSVIGTPLANPGIYKVDVYANAWIKIIFEVAAPGNPQYGGDVTFTMCNELNLDLGENREITTDDEITISANQNNNFHIYEWSNGCSDPTCTINGADLGIGIHTLSVTVRDTVGTTGTHEGGTTRCFKTDTITITVTEENSVSTSDKININIYPNPNNGLFTIDMGQIPFTSLAVIDLKGKIVYESNIENCKQNFKVPNLNKGLYFIKLSDKNREYFDKLVIY